MTWSSMDGFYPPARSKGILRSAGGHSALVAEAPHPLEIVEAAHFGAEQVHDHVAGIDQHPVGGREPFDARIAMAFLLEALGEVRGDRRDLAGRAPGGDHHVVGDARLALERD